MKSIEYSLTQIPFVLTSVRAARASIYDANDFSSSHFAQYNIASSQIGLHRIFSTTLTFLNVALH